MPDDPKPEVKPEAVSPTGQVVGLSALIASLPPSVMNVILAVVALAVSLESVALLVPGTLPEQVVKAAHIVVTFAVVGGLASPGVRK